MLAWVTKILLKSIQASAIKNSNYMSNEYRKDDQDIIRVILNENPQLVF